MKRLKKVSAIGGTFILKLHWDDGGGQTADLSGLVLLSRHFKAFADEPKNFAKVKVINWGHGVEWENGLDYSTENLGRIADEQSIVDKNKLLREFQLKFSLTNEQLGRALGYKVSQVKNFKAGAKIPAAVALATRTMTDNPTLLYARMQGPPAKKIKPRRTAGKDAA